MIELKSIVARPDGPEGFHTFTALLCIDKTQDVEIECPLPAMQSYSYFQKWCLARTGRMFCDAVCEGRTPEAADSCWRFYVSALLNRSAAVAAAVPNN